MFHSLRKFMRGATVSLPLQRSLAYDDRAKKNGLQVLKVNYSNNGKNWIQTEYKIQAEPSGVSVLTWREAGGLATFLVEESVSAPQSGELITDKTHQGLSEQRTW